MHYLIYVFAAMLLASGLFFLAIGMLFGLGKVRLFSIFKIMAAVGLVYLGYQQGAKEDAREATIQVLLGQRAQQQTATQVRQAAPHAIVIENGVEGIGGPFDLRCGRCNTLARYPKEIAQPAADGAVGLDFKCAGCMGAVGWRCKKQENGK